jgi:hypothetical protein
MNIFLVILYFLVGILTGALVVFKVFERIERKSNKTEVVIVARFGKDVSKYLFELAVRHDMTPQKVIERLMTIGFLVEESQGTPNSRIVLETREGFETRTSELVFDQAYEYRNFEIDLDGPTKEEE